jgi:hypothetical protein
MIILMRDDDNIEEVGTVRIVNGEVVFNIPNERALEVVRGRYPTTDAQKYMDNLIGRFMLSSVVFMKKEPGE